MSGGSNTKTSDADGFLTAEAAAQELVKKLKALDEARSGYVKAKKDLQAGFAAAEGTLASAADQIATLSAEVSATGQAVSESLEVVRSAGGPRILEEIRASRDATKEGLSDLPGLREDMEALKAASASVDSQLAKMARTATFATYASVAAFVAVLCTLLVVLMR